MSKLLEMDKVKFEDLFGMRTGYVIDFSNSRFQGFIKGSIDLDIYEDLGYTEYTSKASKLRQIWEMEPDHLVGKLMMDLLDYYEDYRMKFNKITEFDKKRIGILQKVSVALSENVAGISLPRTQDDNLYILESDIRHALAQNQPTLILDRLHTYSVRYLRQICSDNNINISSEKGIKYPLPNLIGSLVKVYEQESLFQSSFSIQAMKSSISLFESFNTVRNTKSYAHDNDVIGNIEASLIVTMISDLLVFIHDIESYRQKIKEPLLEEIGTDL